MSPEQILGGPLDARSDVFSLGTVLHELASGRHPFLKGHVSDTMAAILRDPPASTEGDLDVVPGLGHVVHRMLAKACAERFQTMGEVNAALEPLRQRGSNAPPSSGSAGVSVLRDERTTLVSRDSELAELSAAIDRMLLGEGGFVLLGGEPRRRQDAPGPRSAARRPRPRLSGADGGSVTSRKARRHSVRSWR